jgi:hypothetical protein
VINTPINKIEALRLLKERKLKLSQEQKLILAQGFTTGFWKLMKEQLVATLESVCMELETCPEVERMRILQGEIAALRVLLDWSEAGIK